MRGREKKRLKLNFKVRSDPFVMLKRECDPAKGGNQVWKLILNRKNN